MRKKILVVIGLLLITVLPEMAVVHLNDLVPVFPDKDGDSIEINIIDGAADFLSSYSGALMANTEENSSTNSETSLAYSLSQINTALELLLKAKRAYKTALDIGLKSEYIFYYQDKLRNYDYAKCITEMRLDQNVANEVVSFLKEGNVLGLYRKNIENLEQIQSFLETIRDRLIANNKPDEEQYLLLLNMYNYGGLFGNYATLLGQKAFQGE